jgi:hypothetical protein
MDILIRPEKSYALRPFARPLSIVIAGLAKRIRGMEVAL